MYVLVNFEIYFFSVDMKPVSSSLDSKGEMSKSDTINLYQRVERGLFTIEENAINVKGLKEENDSEWNFYSTQMCKYFGGIGKMYFWHCSIRDFKK